MIIKEIESWYLAGLDTSDGKQLGISIFDTTDNISKEQFVQFCLENPDFILKPDFRGECYICGAGRVMFAISANGDVFPCS